MSNVECRMSNAQSEWLTALNRAPAEEVKAFAEGLLPELEPHGLQVLGNRTGLVMLPGQDTAQGAYFHLGEILVSEARVKLGDAEGYTVCLGRNLEQALAVAILDAAMLGGLHSELIETFVNQQKADQEAADVRLLRQVEATRVEMETF
ncbi:MAG: phosphonate C-P lyase system protein PhnG [Thermaceae bacterium]|nr:phosphonate C-P lyase system protein PhnG [Thermaceae bacterium]